MGMRPKNGNLPAQNPIRLIIVNYVASVFYFRCRCHNVVFVAGDIYALCPSRLSIRPKLVGIYVPLNCRGALESYARAVCQKISLLYISGATLTNGPVGTFNI